MIISNRFFIILFFMLLAFFAGGHEVTIALAQSNGNENIKVDLRSARHDAYTRIVFDWPSAAGYSVSRPRDNQLKITFQKQGDYEFSSLSEIFSSGQSILNILDFKQDDDKAGRPSFLIKIPGEARIRDFSIGSRVILDIFDPPQGAVKSDLKAKEGPAKQPSQDRQNITAKEEDRKSQSSKIKPPVEKTVKAEPVVVEALDEEVFEELEQQVKGFPEPPEDYVIQGNHTYSITSTRAIYLAAFKRAGDLWIVHNQPDNNVPPKLTGPQKDIFPKLKGLDIHNDYKVYKVRLPSNAEVYSEGGGLLWRINIVPDKPEKSPDTPQSVFSGPNNKIGSLLWNMPSADFYMTLKDPDVGDEINVVGVGKANDFSGPERFFIDIKTLPSFTGLAFLPKSDGVTVNIRDSKVFVSKKQGLAISRNQNLKKAFATQDQPSLNLKAEEGTGKVNRLRSIYEFNRWIMGGPLNLRENENLLLEEINQKDAVGKTETLLSLAKLYLANNRGPEALGYLQYAGDVLPDLKESPEFLALMGSAEALAGRFQDAFEDYAAADLDKYHEIDLWRAMVLSGLGDWGQAGEILPEDTSIVNSYPSPLRQSVALSLAEVALRDGRQDQADDLLAIPKATSGQLDRFQKAALDYLSGEAHRQRGENERAVDLWEPLANSLDDLHRVKAGLALTKLMYKMEKIDEAEAIDRLEQLRYSWRGDALEARVYKALGSFYLKNNNFLKGLGILRRGMELKTTPTLSSEMSKMMTEAFETLFLSNKINELSPLEAVSVYEQFQELTPAGKKGDRIVRKLAERLVDVGLLGRASELMNYLIETRLTGINASKAALRLATIQLMDDRPDAALNSLKKAQEFFVTSMRSDLDFSRDIALLKARALSEKGQIQKALETLSEMREQDKDVLRLKADIAWQNGRWTQAAQALERLVARQRISIQQGLTEKQASLILNWAVALNLAGDRRALANVKNRFTSAMAETTRARLFNVVTRARQNVRLTDRETIQAIVSEVDMFSDFLSTYDKSAQETQNN